MQILNMNNVNLQQHVDFIENAGTSLLSSVLMQSKDMKAFNQISNLIKTVYNMLVKSDDKLFSRYDKMKALSDFHQIMAKQVFKLEKVDATLVNTLQDALTNYVKARIEIIAMQTTNAFCNSLSNSDKSTNSSNSNHSSGSMNDSLYGFEMLGGSPNKHSVASTVATNGIFKKKMSIQQQRSPNLGELHRVVKH